MKNSGENHDCSKSTTGLGLLSFAYNDTDESDCESTFSPGNDTSHCNTTAAFSSRNNDLTKAKRMKTSSHSMLVAGEKRRKVQHDSSYAGKQKLPIPDSLKRMYASNTEHTEVNFSNPEVHQGRTRSFAHVRGNWASSVCINFSDYDAMKRVVGIFKQSIEKFDGLAPSKIHVNSSLHLSLTKTQVFRHHWIDQFVQSLKSNIKTVTSFDVVFNSLGIYVNEEKTRTFFALQAFSSESLLRLVEVCDTCLSEYDLQPYYAEPSFHVSFGWMLGSHDEWARNHLVPALSGKWEDLCDDDPLLKKYFVDSVTFRTGDKIFNLPLQQD